jgi:hypothetical protein
MAQRLETFLEAYDQANQDFGEVIAKVKQIRNISGTVFLPIVATVCARPGLLSIQLWKKEYGSFARGEGALTCFTARPNLSSCTCRTVSVVVAAPRWPNARARVC